MVVIGRSISLKAFCAQYLAWNAIPLSGQFPDAAARLILVSYTDAFGQCITMFLSPRHPNRRRLLAVVLSLLDMVTWTPSCRDDIKHELQKLSAHPAISWLYGRRYLQTAQVLFSSILESFGEQKRCCDCCKRKRLED